MPRDQNGIYSLPAGYKAVSGQKVLASQHNPPLEDLAASMTNSLPRTGVAPMTAPLQMGSNPITGMADGSADTDGSTVGQVASVFGAKTGAAPEKTTPVDDDYTPLYDSAASNLLKKLKWSSIKATLKTYLDTLYAPIAFVADLASTAAGKGASLVGVQDSGGKITATTVEGALAELAALTAQIIGVGQTWQNVLASRAVDTSYRNTTGKPIQVWVDGGSSSAIPYVSSDGSTWVQVGLGTGGSMRGFGYFIVPNNHYYKCSGGGAPIHWAELR